MDNEFTMKNTETILTEGDGSPKLVLTNDAPFVNSKGMFIEYDDVIKSPFLMMLYQMRHDVNFNKMFNLDKIKLMTLEELGFWYNNRKNKNVFKCFKLRDDAFDTIFKGSISLFEEFIDELPENELKAFPEFVDYPTYLNFHNILLNVIESKVANKIYIYNEFYNEAIEKDLKSLYGNSVKFIYGDLGEILNSKDLPNELTYVFSDLNKIDYLHRTKRLDGSCILLADVFGYNYKDTDNHDGKREYIINVDEVYPDEIYRLSSFNNTDVLIDEYKDENDGPITIKEN